MALRYISEVLTRLKAEETLAEAETLLSSPAAELSERERVAGELGCLRQRIFGPGQGKRRKNHAARRRRTAPQAGPMMEDNL
jgi:hypothetical protein